MASANHERGFHFSMKSLLIALTIACLVLAIPGGYVLLLAGGAWFLLATAITLVLIRYRAGISRLLSGTPSDDRSE